MDTIIITPHLEHLYESNYQDRVGREKYLCIHLSL